jgi:7-keto-8-aminopelargonate synthetase-like enzyme
VGWSGERGAGTLLGRRSLHARIVVVLGLAKSFAGAGGAVVVPEDEMAERLLTGGRTLIFSGPLQPAQLGAGVASARIHLSAELPLLQARLLSRIDTFDKAAARDGLTLACAARSPIRFVPIGDEVAAIELAAALLGRGYYVNVAYYPAVPRRRAGVRLMLNSHHTHEDIQSLVREMVEQQAQLALPALKVAAGSGLAAPSIEHG